jgi:multidrug efflux pump subunit AcrA (membrane-fusion protein)
MRLQELLDRHIIKAPPGWRIMERSAEPGQWVSAGTVLARAGDYRQLVVPVAVTIPELQSLQAMDVIPVHFSETGISGSGTLYRVSPAFDPVSRKVKAEILIQPETWARLPLKQGGLQAEIPLSIADPMQAFVVPAQAVSERYEEHWLTRPDGSGVRVIVLGPARDDNKTGKDLLRVTSPRIQPGDRFLLAPPP